MSGRGRRSGNDEGRGGRSARGSGGRGQSSSRTAPTAIISHHRPGGRSGEGRGRAMGRGGGGGGRGRGGGRQPDKDIKNVDKEIQVNVNAFELQSDVDAKKMRTTRQQGEGVDTTDLIVGQRGNPLLTAAQRDTALAASGLQPHQYLMRPDGSVLIDPHAGKAKLEKLWATDAFYRTDVEDDVDDEDASFQVAAQLQQLRVNDSEKQNPTTPAVVPKVNHKIPMIEAVHHAWDVQAKDTIIRTGGIIFSTRVTPKDAIVPGVAVRTGHVQSIRQSSSSSSPDPTKSYFITKPVAAPVTVRETLLNFLQGLGFVTTKNNDTSPKMTTAAGVGEAVRGLWASSHHATYKIYLRLDGVQQGSRTPTGARHTFFENKQGQQVSVYDHFQKTHQIQLQYPDLPLVYRRAKSGFIFVPMELLSLVGGKVRQSIRSDEILKRSKMSADEFMKLCQEKAEKTDKYVKHMRRVGDLLISRASLRGVSSEYLKATALVLPTPNVSVKNSKMRKDTKFVPEGNWNWRDRAALIPPPKTGSKQQQQQLTIGFVDGSNMPYAMDNCVEPICKEMKIHTGMKIQSVLLGKASLTDKKALEKLVKTHKIDCLVALLPQQNNPAAYKAVKFVCDSNRLPSQCIKKWDRALSAQHARNLVLKMNGKVGGINHAIRNVSYENYMPLQDKTSNTLFIGIDVYHGGLEVMSDPQDNKSLSSGKSQSGESTSSKERPDSTLAMVGMFGPDLSKTTIALQNISGGTEIMPEGFGAVIQRCLDGWRKKTGTVVVYRDAVGVSSYDVWFETEIKRGFRAVLPSSSHLVVTHFPSSAIAGRLIWTLELSFTNSRSWKTKTLSTYSPTRLSPPALQPKRHITKCL
eukprot:scaffold291_cov168-Amphora_coffeaeformis.AAC.8